MACLARRRRSRIVPLAPLVLALAIAASPLAAGSEPTLSAEEVEQLRALGYLDFGEKVLSEQQSGVVVHDVERSQPGYNLFASRALRVAVLIDARGRAVRSWHGGETGHWSRVRLLDDGDLLVVGSERSGARGGGAPEDRFLERLDFAGERVWRVKLPVHHDVNLAPDGRLLALTLEHRKLPSIDAEHVVRDEGVVVLSPDGRVLERKLFSDLYAAAGDSVALKRLGRLAKGEPPVVDLFHSNSVQWIPENPRAGEHPVYGPGNVLVSMRNQDGIAVFDWAAGRALWAWGHGVVIGPHHATLLENGNVLLFDNRLGEGWSRVIELDPRSEEIVWEYEAPEPGDFYTKSRGAAQRLANGNTLITESDVGHAFEVTRAGEIVWEYWNPARDDAGHPATIIRMIRYDAARVERWLADSAPGEKAP